MMAGAGGAKCVWARKSEGLISGLSREESFSGQSKYSIKGANCCALGVGDRRCTPATGQDRNIVYDAVGHNPPHALQKD